MGLAVDVGEISRIDPSCFFEEKFVNTCKCLCCGFQLGSFRVSRANVAGRDLSCRASKATESILDGSL